ncbi:MAG TPA: serine/threonine-protein kinase [Usitatibacter sp.]|nr:serine/threonine-protein kinase [Usitatibacter sp.]
MDHPKAIGKYSITRPLGKGAMGMVYEGFDPVIERKVAIKTILGEYLEASEMQEAVTRFKREAQAGGRLMHPGIVGVYEYAHEGEMAYIVMEYVEGEELKRALSSGKRYPLIEVFEIMKHLLGALDHAHKQGVVHRDIKPANLMILPGPKVKIMDFGIARLESSNLTQVGTVVGTPTHMAPEQLMGVPADGRADLWASGVILYELLTGASPFLADTPAAVMHKVLQGEVTPPSAVDASLPAGFDGVVARALAKKAEDRFQSAREFQNALLAALQGKLVSATANPRRSPADDRSVSIRLDATQVNATARGGTAARKAPAVTIPPEALAEIERSLSRHVGPLAPLLIQRGQGEAASVEDFFRQLADHIPDAAEQAAFMKKMARVRPAMAPAEKTVPSAAVASAPAAAGATRTTFTPESLAAAEKLLASYVGPLARILIKEAAGKTGNLKELYVALADHIDSDDERRQFLASLPR